MYNAAWPNTFSGGTAMQRKLLILAIALWVPYWAQAGAIFLTGHDPDFHALLGGNTVGARNINTAAIDFILDPAFNPFVAGGTTKFLFVESKISPPGGHTNGVQGIVATGYAPGVDFEHHDATTLDAELDLLGTEYAGIVVASDFGGVLTAAELNILNARSTDIISFLNSGGGVYAMANSNSQAALTTGADPYGYLPFVVTAPQLNQNETGFTVTAFGASLGLSDSDVNGNASHNIFAGTFGMTIVDIDAAGNILSLATRAPVTPGGVVPEPSTMVLFAGASVFLLLVRKRRG
jgi:hypothetical protein